MKITEGKTTETTNEYSLSYVTYEYFLS